MQSVSSRIWTRVAVSISFDDNHYTTDNNSKNNYYEKGEIDNNNKHNENNYCRNRKRKILWFNTPFCKLATINIGKCFLNLMNKQFNRDNPLSKIFNRNTIKIRYSRTNNISKIIYNHNRKLIYWSNLKDKETHKSPCKELKKDALLVEIVTWKI